MRLTRRNFGKMLAGLLAGLTGKKRLHAETLMDEVSVHWAGSSGRSISSGQSTSVSESELDVWEYDYWPEKLHVGMVVADPYGRLGDWPTCWLLVGNQGWKENDESRTWQIAMLHRHVGYGLWNMHTAHCLEGDLRGLPVIANLVDDVPAIYDWRDGHEDCSHFQATYGPLVKGE